MSPKKGKAKPNHTALSLSRDTAIGMKAASMQQGEIQQRRLARGGHGANKPLLDLVLPPATTHSSLP